MRVTGYTILQRWIDDNQARLTELDKYNRQISTGKQLDRASDNPTGANRVMQLDEIVRRNDQYLTNINEAIQYNNTTESVMDNVYSRLIRVKELAVEAASDASMAQAGVDKAFMEELKGIKEAMADLSLSKIEGKYIFNGTAGDTPPFADSTGGPYMGDSNMLRLNLGQGQTVPLNLTGDRAFRETEVRSSFKIFADATSTLPIDPLDPIQFVVSDGLGVDTTITVADVDQATLVSQMNAEFAATGANLTASVKDGKLSIALTDSEAGGEIKVTAVNGDIKGVLGITEGTKNVFYMLDDLLDTMTNGTTTQISSFLDRIDRLSENVANQRGQYGSRARNLEFARDRIEQYNLTSATLKEQVEGADMTKAVMRLNTGEQAYQASLAAGSRIFNISILDFLR